MKHGKQEDGKVPFGGFATTRIEALADGIFAVAMTLLVLDFKLPPNDSIINDATLLKHILSVGHTYIIYLVCFIVLGMFWMSHHAHFHFIRYVDHTLLWINLVFLFGITSIPYATDLLVDHSDLHLPYVLFGIKMLFLAGLLVLQIVYLRRHPRLAEPMLTAKLARQLIWRTLLFASIPLLSMAAVFYNVRIALYLYFLLLIVHFMPGRVDASMPSARVDND